MFLLSFHFLYRKGDVNSFKLIVLQKSHWKLRSLTWGVIIKLRDKGFVGNFFRHFEFSLTWSCLLSRVVTLSTTKYIMPVFIRCSVYEGYTELKDKENFPFVSHRGSYPGIFLRATKVCRSSGPTLPYNLRMLKLSTCKQQ